MRRMFLMMRLVLLFLVGTFNYAFAGDATVASDSKLWDFGQVSQGEILEHTFVLKNDYTQDMHIKHVRATCGCTTVALEKKIVAPGESVDIAVKFDTRGYSKIVKQFVHAHIVQPEESVIKFSVQADILAPDVTSDAAALLQNKRMNQDEVSYFWDFGLVSQGEILEHTFMVKNDSSSVMKITNMYSPYSYITSAADREVIPPGESVAIKVKFDTNDRLGRKERILYINTAQSANPVISLILRAHIHAQK